MKLISCFFLLNPEKMIKHDFLLLLQPRRCMAVLSGAGAGLFRCTSQKMRLIPGECASCLRSCNGVSPLPGNEKRL